MAGHAENHSCVARSLGMTSTDGAHFTKHDRNPVLIEGGRALSSGSIEAWFVDEYQTIEPEADLQPVLARVGIFSPAGLGLGSLVGGVLHMILGEVTSPIGNFGKHGANLVVIVLLVGVQFLLTFLLVKEPEHPDRQGTLCLDSGSFLRS